MSRPLVSIICICHNQRPYVEAAILSALKQTYENIELIVVDDASTDGSPEMVGTISEKYGFRVLLNSENTGNCRAFNRAFSISSGAYIIDLAADDILMPGRVEAGVEALERQRPDTGVHFCNVEHIDAAGNSLCKYKQMPAEIPTGDIYVHVLKRHFISAPTMLFRRIVIEKLGGYDESLSYEDFDFWVRSSRYFRYAYTDRVMVKKRVLHGSHGTARLSRKNVHILSTARVCEKALEMNRSDEENQALARRCMYEMKWAVLMERWDAAKIFLSIMRRLELQNMSYYLGLLAVTFQPPLYRLMKWLSRDRSSSTSWTGNT